MKKVILLLCLLCALPIMAQKSKTFKVACLNIDGLPPEVNITAITKVKLNPEGPQAAGTAKMSELVSQKGWDFFGISEAFNFNNEFISKIKNQYNTGTFRDAIPTSMDGIEAIKYVNIDLSKLSVSEDSVKKSFNTDGLNILYKTSVSVSNEKWTGWKMRNGVTKNGADMLIDKGYRYYTVSLGPGLDIDVYLLHMDAETTERDNVARAVQIKQLVEAIKATDNKRPIIIMGDTNCRYTRDDLEGLLINSINADPRFEIHDPWVEYMWDGRYPPCNGRSLMVSEYGYQKGEVVDKIFYINNKDADAQLTAHGYLQDMDFTWPDGSEISDHFPIVIKFTIESTKGGVAAGTKYVIRNRATGEYLNYDGPWRCRAQAYHYGVEFNMEDAGNGSFYLNSVNGYVDSDFAWCNKASKEKGAFTFRQVGQTKYYNIICANGDAVVFNAPDSEGHKEIGHVALDTDDTAMQWELLTWADMKDELADANNSWTDANPTPINVSNQIVNPRFSPNSDAGWTSTNGGGAKHEWNGPWTGDYSCNQVYKVSRSGSKSNWTLSQEISDLPAGLYEVKCNIALFNLDDVTLNLSSGSNTKTLSMNRNGDNSDPGFDTMGKTINSTDAYKRSLEIEASGSLKINIDCPNHSSKYYVYLDNFELIYHGPTAATKAARDKVKKAIDDAQKKADEAGYTTYDNSVVEERYNEHNIMGNGDEEVHMTYLQLANAARKQTGEMPVDMRYALLNNSFEMGDLTEWVASNATADDVKTYEQPTDDEEYYVSTQAGRLTQTIQVTMPAGVYSLKAKVSPGAILVADAKESTPAEGDGEWIEKELKFIISKGTATVGVRCDGPFRADQLILSRISDASSVAGYELIELAISDATKRVKAMGSPYNDNWDLSKYQQIIDELSLEGDGTKEFYEIYGMLREQVYAQPGTTGGANYTNAIINPSFEFGSTVGWNATLSSESGVKENSNTTYNFSSADGDYVFNTWDNGRGTIISQTISGLPSGHYRLVVTLASDQGNWLAISANDKTETRQMDRAANVGSDYLFEFDVAKDTKEVTISVRGANGENDVPEVGGAWYKADNFRLYRHDDGEFKSCDFYNRLQTAIRRLATMAAELPEKYRTQWDAHDYQDLIDEHVNSNHVDDPMGSNGNKEINELYARFRTLVFSQTETGADMSGAIMNQSFELGDLTGWDITSMGATSDIKVTVNTGNYTMADGEIDGSYLFNSWLDNISNPLTQTIQGVPAGIYRLSAKVASDAGNRFYLAVNNTPGEMLTISSDKTHFEDVSVEFEVTAAEAGENGAEIVIGLYPTFDGVFDSDKNPAINGPWFKADNFALQLIGRNVDIKWAMEHPEQGYGTLILPFDSNIPEDLEIHSLSTSKVSDAFGETYYQIAQLEKKDKILANTPYVVTRKAAATTPEAVPQSRAAAIPTADENGVYTFSGITTHTKDTYTDGMLTGSLVAAPPTNGERHLQIKDGNIGFILHDGTLDHEDLPPYHAYISGDIQFKDEEGNVVEFVPDVYFDEPETTVEWTMETALYGTIILPFDADEPVTQGLIAYEITGLGDASSYLSKLDNTEYEYQLINLTRVEDEIMKAYTPYLLFGSPTPEATAAEDDTADAPRTLTFKGKADNGTGATLENGLLKGVLTSGVHTAADDFILTYDNRNKEVFSMAQTPQEVAVNHAYILQEKATGEAPSLLFFEAPTADDIQSGLQVVAIDSEAIVDVFSIDGITLRTGIEAAEALDGLAPGIYVLRTASGATLKVLKR